MTDVSFCEDGVVFFIFSVVGRLTGRGWAVAVYPAGVPRPPAHPDRLHTTGNRASRARCKADRPQQAAHRHTRPDTGHAAPVCTRYQTGNAGQIGTVQGTGLPAQCVRNCADMDTHKPPCIKSHFCEVLLRVQRFYPLQSHTSVIL